MTEEQENKEKRKMTPLTKEEYLTFFFIPFYGLANGFNESEENRFKKHGYEKKLVQMESAQFHGKGFYALLFFIIMLLLTL